MADAPWVKIYTGDFLQGVGAANLKADEIGVYAVVLFLIAERGGPIEDDRRWLAGRAGCRSTRHCSQIIERLIVLGKLESRDGLLGNSRMIEEVERRSEKSQQASRAARARWDGASPQQPLDFGNSENIPKKTAGKNRDKIKVNDPIKSKKSQKSANPDDADASCLTRAPDSEPRDSEPFERTDNLGGDVERAWQAISAAAGYVPTDARRIAEAYDLVREWLAAGIGVDEIILPTIRSMIAKSDDHTSSLRRFDKQIRHQAAKSGAASTDRPYRPPETPTLLFDGEDERIRPIRDALLTKFGPSSYPSMCHRVRFKIAEAGNGSEVVQITDEGNGAATRLKDQLTMRWLSGLARHHGFADAW